MKSSSAQKLLSYSAFATAYLLTAEKGDAAIIYTDVVPDVIVDIPGYGVDLDLNGDSIVDFTIFLSTLNFVNFTFYGAFNFYQRNGIFAIPQNSNSIAAEGDVYAYPYAIYEGIEIGPYGEFKNVAYQTLAFQYYAVINSFYYVPIFYAGNWVFGETDKFLGLKLIDDGNTYYSWVRLDVASDNRSFTIKDFAYNNAPDSSIETQIFLTPVAEIPPELNANIYGFTDEIHILINSEDLSADAFVTVYDLAGKEIMRSLVTQMHQIITPPSISHGVYLVNLVAGDKYFTRKIYLSAK